MLLCTGPLTEQQAEDLCQKGRAQLLVADSKMQYEVALKAPGSSPIAEMADFANTITTHPFTEKAREKAENAKLGISVQPCRFVKIKQALIFQSAHVRPCNQIHQCVSL